MGAFEKSYKLHYHHGNWWIYKLPQITLSGLCGFRSSNKKNPFKSGQAKRQDPSIFLNHDGFMVAFGKALVLKRSQFSEVIATAPQSKTESAITTKTSAKSKQITNHLLSHLNYVHGNNYTTDYFLELFNNMIEFEKNLGLNNVKTVPLLFLMYVLLD